MIPVRVKAAVRVATVIALAGCSSPGPTSGGGWFILRWMEKPSADGPSRQAAPEDQTEFLRLVSYDESPDESVFEKAKAQLEVGDVIAYRMDKWEARRDILMGDVTKIGYRLLRYGHLAVVVEDPADPTRLRVFSSQSFKGPNVREDLDSLEEHDWDAYRLDKYERLDQQRLNEFVRVSMQKAGEWYGYDFSGMFGLWNSNLRPRRPEEVGHDYICSTVVAAAFYYSGLELDAIERQTADLVTPQQVVSSRGRFVPLPEMVLEVEPSAGE